MLLWKKENDWNKDEWKLFKERNHCKDFRFISDLNSTNADGEFETNYCNICFEVLELGKENTGKHNASLLDSDFEIRNGKFQVALLDETDSFPFLLLECVTGQVIYLSL